MSKKRVVAQSVITTIFLGLLIYSSYSLWYVFYGKDSGADVHLYTILSGCALGWFLSLLAEAIFKKTKIIPQLLAFVAGNGLFQGIIWGFNADLNQTATDNEAVIIKTYTVAFSIAAITLLVAFILRAKKSFKVLNIILAVVYFIISAGGGIVFNIDNIKALEYKKNVKFGTITAQEMAISPEEKKLCKDWYAGNILGEDGNYPFTFKIDGKKFDASQWAKSVEQVKNEDIYEDGVAENIIFKNKNNGLEIRVEAISFNAHATCQWTVYIKNTSKEKSAAISDFYALDSSLSTGEAKLYYSLGSDTAASDFSLVEKKLSSSEKAFSGNEGKPTEKYLPYFNICGEKYGVVMGIGWTGQWGSTFSCEDEKTNISVKQDELEGYLLPGEEIRSPLVSLSFYKNTNALKGFNLFRNWIMDSVYPKTITKNYYTVMEVAGPMSLLTSDEIISVLDNKVAPDVYENIDAFWMDAGWYSYNEGWYDGVGNWTVDTTRYDNGISELSSYAEDKGLGHVLWYEPERVCKNTLFYNKGSENEGWLIDIGEDNLMWNLANEDALKYYCEYIANSLKENGVTVYRQDFNFAPHQYWQKADNEYYDGRKGFCENHYVTNLYAFLDYLYENVDGLIIDNCASGGKRLDLEMTYRSIPFWRSDYNCSYHSDFFEATQSHTYGISFWLPISGANLWMEDEYSARSAIMPLMLMDFYSHHNDEFSYHNEQRALMGGNYYPIDFGSFDKNKMHAMQFDSGEGKEGTVLIYKREDVKDKEYTVNFNGLSANAIYTVYDVDNSEEIQTLSGKQLMNDGITLKLPEGKKAIILMYKQK